MGAREDLLEAARTLTQRGVTPFSPAQLIAEARSQGSQYKDATLRAFVIGPMCTNSPDHHAVQYGDLYRVSRGQYRLQSDAGGRPITRRSAELPDGQPNPPEQRALEADDWRWEGNVQAAVVRHLAAAGWNIRRVADTASRERGVDIEAVKPGRRLLIEVKGYPSANYSAGPKQGQAKPTGAALQARHYYAGALLSGLLLRTEHPDAHVVLAFPDAETYRALAGRTVEPLQQAKVELWLVHADGEVTSLNDSPADLDAP